MSDVDPADSWEHPERWNHQDNGRLCDACWDDWPCQYALDDAAPERTVLRAGDQALEDLLDRLDDATADRSGWVEPDQRPVIVRHVKEFVVWVDADPDVEDVAAGWRDEPYGLVDADDEPFDAYIDVENVDSRWGSVYERRSGPAWKCPDCGLLAGPDLLRHYTHRVDCPRVALVAAS
ncbi:hypothetical protein MXD62_13165 [Frankia sp. Mgl5]|uniref:hypothetical protein n=1 Tax=Frankia sp. Mgl5 TaxID=2933793 RepID=UPI00200C7E79|nr:hypothetical protein [Frankia sp. Mgl5]MCK9928111.1 hypothetical protein [Frankia sp. Mgl5]